MAETVKTDLYGDASINFRNLGSVLQVVVPVEQAATFTSLTVSTDSEVFITRGKANMKTGAITATEKSTKITLSFGSGITVSAGNQLTANILVAPVDLSGKKLNLKLSSNSGEVQFSTTGKTFSAGKAYRYVKEKSIEEIPYLTFSADGSHSLSMELFGSWSDDDFQLLLTIEYSVNNGPWHRLYDETVNFGGSYGDIRIRGKCSKGTYK